jgi:hypothetical protein
METWDPNVPDGILMDTAKIARALKEFGGFPERYYVRLEEIMVFQNFGEMFLTQEGLRVAILGSPGVDKFVFLMLLAFYLAQVHSKSVIVLRKLKEGEEVICMCACLRQGCPNQGCHKERFWRKITVRTSSGRPPASAFIPRTRFYPQTGFYRPPTP